jgi:DNA repair protein RadC
MKKSKSNICKDSAAYYKTRIPMRFWAEDNIPGEKLLLKGTSSLSDAELLSIIIGTGVQGENSLDIAQKLLNISGNNLNEFFKSSVHELMRVKGIGSTKAAQICAVFALSSRKNESYAVMRDKISISRHAFEIFHSLISDIPYEEFWILLLNRANKVLKKIKISEGGISGTVVDPKKIFKIALDHHASSIILGHNHPSGQCSPSDADIKITKKVRDAGLLLEITVLDHIIVAGDSYYSFADEGAL